MGICGVDGSGGGGGGGNDVIKKIPSHKVARILRKCRSHLKVLGALRVT
jgi:hypothetical protein